MKFYQRLKQFLGDSLNFLVTCYEKYGLMGQVILSEKTAFLLRSRWITVLKINKTRDALKAENDMFASYDFLSFFENFSFEIGGHDCSLKLHEVLLGVRTLVKDKINHALKYNDA